MATSILLYAAVAKSIAVLATSNAAPLNKGDVELILLAKFFSCMCMLYANSWRLHFVSVQSSDHPAPATLL
jgi:hypothetical protein